MYDDLELLEHTDIVNELLARYGVKFGIYKNNTLKNSFFRLMQFLELSGCAGGFKDTWVLSQ